MAVVLGQLFPVLSATTTNAERVSRLAKVIYGCPDHVVDGGYIYVWKPQ